MKTIIVTVGMLLLCSVARAQSTAVEVDWDRLLARHTITDGDSKLPYRFLKPDGYATDGKDRFPLVIFLHGIGERGTDNERQLKNGVEHFVTEAARRKHPCFLVVPQCPPDKLWCDLSRGTRRNNEFKEKPTEPLALVISLIDKVSREHRVDRDRIYLTGLSMGGYGTWDLITRKPELFAAAMPVCGGGAPEQAKKLVKLPIWGHHGGADFLVPTQRSRDMVEAIKQAGGDSKYTEYEGVGHDSWTPTYANEDVLDWLFNQKKVK